MAKEILDWPCVICGVANRYHKVFRDPNFNETKGYTRQFQLWDGPDLVKDHWAKILEDNLEYLEWKHESRNK